MTPTRKLGIGAFLLGSVVGGAFGVSGLANAASDDTTATTTPVVTDDSSSTTSDASDDTGATSDTDTTGDVPAEPAGAPAGPHIANGITEEELTGDTAASVEAAVLAAYPDATIERMETDAEGDAYEAHVTLADGSRATVELDSAFTVTGTETGPDGHRGGPGGACDDATATTDTATADDTATT